MKNLFIAIDFDGTITDRDITDAVIQRFARPGWEKAEEEWEKGLIGSRECLERQMALIDAPLPELLKFADRFTVDRSFPGFVGFLRRQRIPHAVVSDGFKVFSERILKNAGITDIPVFANGLREENGRIKTFFPNKKAGCFAGTCKCMVAGDAGGGAPVILIGDGRSDFCLAEKSLFVFAKKKLAAHCKTNGLFHIAYESFRDIEKYMSVFVTQLSGGERLTPSKKHVLEGIEI